MRMHILAAGIAAAALIPSFAFAQQDSCLQAQNNRTAGTVAGAGLGALFGSAVAGKGDRTTGAILGAIGGGIVGNQITKNNADCSRAYGYYDNNGLWHASGVSRQSAAGYYDRSGAWVEGAPNGYYNAQGAWTRTSGNATAAGYYDSQNRWVPASATGYYDNNGRWVGGAASGYYDTRGQWIAGPAIGRYDSDGRWMSGQANGRMDGNGVWISDPQPGYYDNGRWRAGTVTGYYDTQGRWFTTGAPQVVRTSYGPRGNWDGAPQGVIAREAWLDQQIRAGRNDGTLSRSEANRSLDALDAVRREERGLRHYRGQLNDRDEARIQNRLDTVASNIDWQRRNDRQNDRQNDRRDDRQNDRRAN